MEKTIQARIYRSDSERLYQIGVAIAAQRDGKVPSVADVVHELIEREEARDESA
jgi:hypothetical protein